MFENSFFFSLEIALTIIRLFIEVKAFLLIESAATRLIQARKSHP